MMTLGARIRELRTDKHFSLRTLATKAGIAAPYLCDIELGRRVPSKKVLGSIARQLNVSASQFRRFDTKPYTRELKSMIQSNPELGPLLVKYARKVQYASLQFSDIDARTVR